MKLTDKQNEKVEKAETKGEPEKIIDDEALDQASGGYSESVPPSTGRLNVPISIARPGLPRIER